MKCHGQWPLSNSDLCESLAFACGGLQPAAKCSYSSACLLSPVEHRRKVRRFIYEGKDRLIGEEKAAHESKAKEECTHCFPSAGYSMKVRPWSFYWLLGRTNTIQNILLFSFSWAFIAEYYVIWYEIALRLIGSDVPPMSPPNSLSTPSNCTGWSGKNKKPWVCARTTVIVAGKAGNCKNLTSKSYWPCQSLSLASQEESESGGMSPRTNYFWNFVCSSQGQGSRLFSWRCLLYCTDMQYILEGGKRKNKTFNKIQKQL